MSPTLSVNKYENSANNEIYNRGSSLQNIDVKEMIQAIKQEVMQELAKK